MAHTKSILYYSLISALVMMPFNSYSAVKISNKSRSYANAYNQVNEARASVAAPTVASAHTDDLGLVGKTEESDTMVDLPIRVANETLATQIARGESTSVTYGQLESCGAVYPNGEFAWDTPTAGVRAGTGSQCTSVVEMRGYQMGPGGSDLVLARVNVAAGDGVKCNIYAWPESARLAAAGTIEFPHDAEPTVEDVIAVMNQEQKQHAGIKIAAATVLAAVAGNALGANEIGNDAILGTNKEKLQSTAIGAAAGAAIMAGNVYGGKVAGDMILSAGVNAAAGGLIGNMLATDGSELKIEKCTHNAHEYDCLWGNLVEPDAGPADSQKYFYHTKENRIYFCESRDNSEYKECKLSNENIEDIVLQGYEALPDCKWGECGTNYLDDKIKKDSYKNVGTACAFVKKNSTSDEDDTSKIKCDNGKLNDSNPLVEIKSALIIKKKTSAIYVNIPSECKKDWGSSECEQKKKLDANVYARNAKGEPVALAKEAQKETFRPIYQDAEDGALIDMDNKARLTETLAGAGAGGALGAFTAYQGAQDEIQQRWVTAVREYKDSLQKVYCATGNRFLTYYNDVVLIPEMTE